MSVTDWDKLEIWVKASDFAVSVYCDAIPCLPDTEIWNLAQQLRRAAQSIPANIAAGHGRYHFLDNVRFCYIARGSLTGVQCRISLAHRLGYLATEVYGHMTRSAELVGKQLNAYTAYLKRAKPGADVLPAGHAPREASENYLAENPEDVI